MAKLLHPPPPPRHRPGIRADHHLPWPVMMIRSARLFFHVFLCISALVLGFRLAGSFSFLMQLSNSSSRSDPPPNVIMDGDNDSVVLKFPYISESQKANGSTPNRSGRNVIETDGHDLMEKDGHGVHRTRHGDDASFSDAHEDVSIKHRHDNVGITHRYADDTSTVDVQHGHDGIVHESHNVNAKTWNSQHGQLGHSNTGVKSTRVHVGRHEILIRPQPHPDPVETMKAHRLLDIVQNQQRLLYGSRKVKQSSEKNLLVITPTFSRTFQTLHMMSVIHTLRNVPSPLTWIVIEAGGVSDETRTLLINSRLPYHHLGLVDASTPSFWSDRAGLEARLRAEGLSFVRQRRLEGIVVFVDDSNAHSLEFFTEARKTVWLGAFSVGLLQHSGTENENLVDEEPGTVLPVQGPKCDSKGHIIGWYMPTKAKKMTDIIMAGNILEWAGFSFNAKLLWRDQEIPEGLRSWDEILRESNKPSIQSPLEFVWRRNMSLVEPLGNCGRDILLWWFRVEARPDSKFPSKWIIYPQLEIVVPSRRTPWPDFLPLPPPKTSDSLHSLDARRHSKGKLKRRAKKGSLGDPKAGPKV